MLVIKRVSPKYEAVQFNKEGDFPGVKRGYAHNKGGHTALFISDSFPRSPEYTFCYVLENGIDRFRVSIGDWILTETGTNKVKRKVMPDSKFKKKYVVFSPN